MSRDHLNRRHFLASAIVGAGALAGTRAQLFPYWKKLRQEGSQNAGRLRVAVSNWVPTPLAQDIEANYLHPMAALFNLQLDIQSVANESLFHNTAVDPLNPNFDVAITSTNFHSWLHAEHACMSSLPFGLPRDRKAAWLFSNAGKSQQEAYFGFLGLKPQVVGLGSDQVGCFSKIQIDSPQALRGNLNSIAISDSRATWFVRQRMAVRKLNPYEQTRELNNGALDISEPLSPTGSLNLIDPNLNHEENWTYNLFPEIRTAPTIFCLWRKSIWDLHTHATSDSSKNLQDLIWQQAFEKVSHAWSKRENQALDQIRLRHKVVNIPRTVVELFRADAAEHLQALGQRSALAKTLVESYSTAVI